MKRFFFRATVLLLTLCAVVTTFYSCDASASAQRPSYAELKKRDAERQRKEQIKRLYRAPMEQAALQMTKHISNIISPRSGRSFFPEVDVNDMQYYEPENVVIAYTKLRWQARDLLRGVLYGTCEVGGVLRLYMPQRSIDSPKATFQYQTRNEHVQKVSDSEDWQEIGRGLVITLE